ncbi:MAG: hypothetical protein FWC70_03315 [Defluviitaleaceae bacterium]|nr:hypothetical protein [Defluviitaleaceae bacterium]
MKINLLPPSAKNAQKFRTRIKILLLAQCGIFLILAAVIFYLNNAEREVWHNSRVLSEKVSAIASAADDAAGESAAREMFADAMPIIFEGDRLDDILFAIPQSAVLSRIDYNRNELLISAYTADINIIEQHRVNMTRFFTYVRPGRIRGDAEQYFYELRVIFEE